MMLLQAYRRARVAAKQLLMVEPRVRRELRMPLEFHGNDYCGWSIPHGVLRRDSVVVDVGLGEDISFSKSLLDRYQCTVHGFDPTPRAIAYVKSLRCDNFHLHEYGVAAQRGTATFYLPINEAHVSGSLIKESHVGNEQIQVQLICVSDIFEMVGAERISLLKLDIEGAEYDLLASPDFASCASRIDVICIEFHHRWKNYGPGATLAAVATLNSLGFRCAWRAAATNEEFLFLNSRSLSC